MKMPKIDKETIEFQRRKVEASEKEEKFKEKSNKVMEEFFKENEDLATEVILPTLESEEKSEDYKAGYLAGMTTLYSLFKIKFKKI